MDRRRCLEGVAASLAASIAGCLGGDGDQPATGDTTGYETGADGGSIPEGAALGYTHATPSGNRVVEGQGAVTETEPLDVPLNGTPAWLAAAPIPRRSGVDPATGAAANTTGSRDAVTDATESRDTVTDATESRDAEADTTGSPDAATDPTEPLDAATDGTGSPDATASVWVVALDDGRLQAVRIPGEAGQFDRIPVTPGRLPAGTPPLVAVTGEETRAVRPQSGASHRTHPVPVGGKRLSVDGDGSVVVRGDREHRFAVDALPDARPAVAGSRAVVPAGATTRYDHGALGDETEAADLAVIDAAVPELEARIDLSPAVFEGVGPILTGAWGDPAVVVTESDADDGARVVAYRPDGQRIAAGEPIGSGFRWRHQLCVAPFAPDGVPELAAVRTPHIGGIVEFYRRDGDRLRIVASLPGFSSHAFGSPNLDGGVAGDFDGDGRLELAVPTNVRDRIGGIRRTPADAAVAWHLDVGGEVTTNLAAAPRKGRLALGVGRDGALRVW